MENFISPKALETSLREAFGEKLELPLVFGFSDTPVADTPGIAGCIFKTLDLARHGTPVALSEENVLCGGGRAYTGFAPMKDTTPDFVSLQEKYKRTPDMFREYVCAMDLRPAEKPYINFVRLDKAETLEGMEGLIFYATPDILSGLATWAYFDNNDEDAVSAPFASGCGSMITMAVRENRLGGRRVFIGLLDPSVRAFIGAGELGFVIPRSRFATMQHTLRNSCLFGTRSWSLLRSRINSGES